MKLYEIFIDNRLDYEDYDFQSKLIVANSQEEAEIRAKNWMKEEFGCSYREPISWAEERTEVDGFKIIVTNKVDSIKDFDIWCEGFVATGERGHATLLGHSKGEDLKDACVNYAKQNKEFARYFNENTMAYWGCQIYDNETDARKSFG